MMGGKVYLVAAEPSGDLLASEIVQAIRSVSPDTQISGVGGSHLEQVGIRSPVDTSELSVVGLIEGLKIYKRVIELADKAADEIVREAPSVVGLVDSWGYTLRVAQRVRQRAPETPLVKIVGPQVWATRSGRAETLAKAVDHLVCIHAFETPFYEPYGLPVTVMGNPALSRGHKGDRQAGRTALGVSGTEPLLLVLPGSRRAEIEQVGPVLVEAARIVKERLPDARIVFHPAESVRSHFIKLFEGFEQWAFLSAPDADRFDVMASADFAMACSGTVTSELALQSTPFLVGYHTGWVTWALARFFLFKRDHITLLNIAADDTDVVPEFVQRGLKAQPIADLAIKMLENPHVRSTQTEAQNRALSRMGESQLNSAKIAAETLLAYT